MAENIPGKLSALAVKNAKPKESTRKLSDGKGLYLEIRPNGSKYFRYAYRYQNKQKTLALGVYPDVTLAEAREMRLQARRKLVKGIDPCTERKQGKSYRKKNTFEAISNEWQEKMSSTWSTGHADKVRQTIKADVLPYFRDRPIKEIKAPDILSVIRRIEGRGALDVADRVKQKIRSIINYAIATGRAETNPADALKDVLKKPKVIHRKALEQKEIPYFLNALDDYRGKYVTRLALAFIVHTFVRPGELRSAEWKDFELENGLWRIPAEKMKMNEEHIVPLSKQVVAILHDVNDRTGKYQLVFPNSHDYRKVMSENTLTYGIRKQLGFDATAHGFRTTASTILNEAGFRVDVIERQLAHGERNKVRAAYNRSQYLVERAKMMQWYSDYLEGLKNGANVVPIYKDAS